MNGDLRATKLQVAGRGSLISYHESLLLRIATLSSKSTSNSRKTKNRGPSESLHNGVRFAPQAGCPVPPKVLEASL